MNKTKTIEQAETAYSKRIKVAKKAKRTKRMQKAKIHLIYFLVIVDILLIQYAVWQGAKIYSEMVPKVQNTVIEFKTPSKATTMTKTAIPVAKAEVKEASKAVKTASWYDYTLKGIKWSENHLTCASRTLKRYSKARVTNIATGKSIECYVNDYIEHPERDIDLSSYAFSQLADLKLGLIKVYIEQL